MLRPPATESSSTSSNRFFSRTTVFKKSVLSMCGAYKRREISVKLECATTTYELLIKVHLDHRLYRVPHVHELEELKERCYAIRLFVLRRLVCVHLRRSPACVSSICIVQVMDIRTTTHLSKPGRICRSPMACNISTKISSSVSRTRCPY